MKILEITKKELLNILNENEYELTEMGVMKTDPGARKKYDIAKKDKRPYLDADGEIQYKVKKGELDVPASIAGWFVGDIDKLEKLGFDAYSGKDVPVRYWIQNKTGKIEDSIIIFCTGGLIGDERLGLNEFKMEYREDLELVKKNYPEINPDTNWVYFPNTKNITYQQNLPKEYQVMSSEVKDNPATQRSKEMRSSKGQDHTVKDIEEDLLRHVYKVLRKFIVVGNTYESGDGKPAIEFNEKLTDLGIPKIIFNRQAKTSIRDISNEKFYFKLFNIMYHETIDDYRSYIYDRVELANGQKSKDEVPVQPTVQVARQEVPKQDVTWGVERGMTKVDKSERLPGYGTYKGGYREVDNDIAVRNIFEVNGQLMGNQYKWTISMSITVYKKQEDDITLKNTSGNVVRINVNQEETDPNVSQEIKSEAIANDIVVVENTPIVDTNPQILSTLKTVIDDFKAKFNAITPDDILELANFDEEEAPDFDELLEEMSRKVLAKLKKKNL